MPLACIGEGTQTLSADLAWRAALCGDASPRHESLDELFYFGCLAAYQVLAAARCTQVEMRWPVLSRFTLGKYGFSPVAIEAFERPCPGIVPHGYCTADALSTRDRYVHRPNRAKP
jgi:hypothetical protein